MVAESEAAIKSSGSDAEEEGGVAARADDLQRALLAHTCMVEAGRGLVDVLRYLACVCVAVYHFSDSKTPTLMSAEERLNSKRRNDTKAKLKSLQARLQVHAAAIQNRVETGGFKVFETEAARAEVRSAVEAVKILVKEGHEEVGTLMAAVDNSAAATNAEPTIPCELCNMMVGVSLFGHHLLSRHGIAGTGNAAGGGGGGGDDRGGGGGGGGGGSGGLGFGSEVTGVWRLPAKVFVNANGGLQAAAMVDKPEGASSQLESINLAGLGKGKVMNKKKSRARRR